MGRRRAAERTVRAMSIAITDDHRALADTVADFLVKHDSRGAARALLEAEQETSPAFFGEAAALGWLGLHVPEAHGGSGYGIEELVVVVEQLGRAIAPGPFVPTVIASAVIAAAGSDEQRQRLLPGLADGTTCGAVALGGDAELRDGSLHGSAGVVLGAGLADVLLVPVGDDVAVIDASGGGLSVTMPKNLDPTRRAATVTFDSAAADVIPGARGILTTWHGRSWPPRRSGLLVSARIRPPSTPRCASSSGARSRPSRR